MLITMAHSIRSWQTYKWAEYRRWVAREATVVLAQQEQAREERREKQQALKQRRIARQQQKGQQQPKETQGTEKWRAEEGKLKGAKIMGEETSAVEMEEREGGSSRAVARSSREVSNSDEVQSRKDAASQDRDKGGERVRGEGEDTGQTGRQKRHSSRAEMEVSGREMKGERRKGRGGDFDGEGRSGEMMESMKEGEKEKKTEIHGDREREKESEATNVAGGIGSGVPHSRVEREQAEEGDEGRRLGEEGRGRDDAEDERMTIGVDLSQLRLTRRTVRSWSGLLPTWLRNRLGSEGEGVTVTVWVDPSSVPQNNIYDRGVWKNAMEVLFPGSLPCAEETAEKCKTQ